jgi:uracil-DNA glycosylase
MAAVRGGRRLVAVAGEAFNADCVRCPRLAAYLADGRARLPGYRGLPVPAFGAEQPGLLVVGLAPGLHGANRTGRPFTGDHAGILLYATLHEYGFASGPESLAADDGLRLIDARITNAARCAPPANKPLPAEVRACAGYLAADLDRVRAGGVILALGRIAHEAVLAARGLRGGDYPFAHAARHELPGGRTLLDSYHCSRYNTQTRRLTPVMFGAVFATARALLDGRPAEA